MFITLAILAVSAVFFALGRIRSDIVALCALLLLLFCGILTPEEALSGFSNPVVVMMVGLFVVGGAIFQTGLAKMVSGRIMKLAGTHELTLFLLVVLVTAVIGAFVSNTGTVALMLPIVVSLASATKMNASQLLMPLAFASSMGGMLTLIGTPPNLVINEVLVEAGYPLLSFFSFSPVGMICIAVGIVVMYPLCRWLLSGQREKDRHKTNKGKSLRQLVDEYRLTDDLARYRVPASSPLKGMTIGKADIHNRYGLTVLELRREGGRQHHLLKSVAQQLVGPGTVVEEGDILYLSGDGEQAQRFAADYGLQTDENLSTQTTLDFYHIGMAELVLLPTSRLVNRQLKEGGFRGTYSINVIAIRRKGEYIMESLPDMRLQAGDVLLVQGTWDNIARLGNDEDRWVVLGQPLDEAAKVTLDYKAPLAACIMCLMVASMVFDFIPIAPVTAVITAAVLMVLTGCFKNVEAAYKTINWESVVLIAAMLPMSVALEKTGASAMLSHMLVASLGNIGPLSLLAGVYFTTSLLTLFISNTATAVLMAPIALSSAVELGVSPYPYLFAVTVAASMCFASPFSTPPNALVMQAGQYRFIDYIRVGLPLQVIMGLVMIGVLPLLFPLTQ
ncbi:MAG: SLC13 family permease [Prevotellaceae bacterium]|nr:SLC13 family permease [Prevotellaceae bacterium]